MHLKSLNRMDLDLRIKTLAQQERELLLEVLLTIKEIDTRKTYLDFGYSSLFSYLVEKVGYSEGSAQRRIEGARLLREAPALGQKIESGEIGLNQIAMVQKAARDVFKRTATKVSGTEKTELLNQLRNLNHKESQKEIASFFDLPVLQETHTTVQADDSLRTTLTIPKELREKIQQAQALLSHALPDQDILSYLEYVTDLVIKQKTSVRNLKSKASFRESNTEPKSTAMVAVESFSARDKKIILNKQPCCQYRDPITKKLCGSRWFPQVDHRQSAWADGKGTIENGQVLCAAHNRMKYRQESGVKLTS